MLDTRVRGHDGLTVGAGGARLDWLLDTRVRGHDGPAAVVL